MKNFLALFLLLFTCNVFFAETITLGGKSGWDKLQKMEGVSFGTGRFGLPAIELSTDSKTLDSYTDLFVDFENRTFLDSAKNYVVKKNSLSTSAKSYMGKSSGISRGRGGLVLSGNGKSIFGSEGPTGSFYIEFWLCPSVVENGEVVFSWRSSRNFFNDILYQMISASFYRGHLEWTLTNVFDGFSGNDIVLEGTTRLVPEKWSHHSFCYSEENGMLEYRMNGMLEAITYATTTSRDAGTVHQLFLGYPSTVEFCPKYTGLIDDIRIQKGYDEGRVSGYSKYNVNGGRIETRPLLASTGASLNFIEGLFDAVGETEIQVYVRSGDEFFNWTDSFPEWKPVILGQEIFDVTGRYFQVALDLFPDGSGKRTPSVSELKITYTPLPEPLPPFAVDVVAGNESVKVSWQKSVDESVGGYLLYYGTLSGEYLGRNAFEGMSPVNVGDVTSFELSGLRNGTIYYITIASYSKYDGRIVGAFSKEVFARPSVTGEKYGK